MNMNIKKKEKKSGYTMTAKAKKARRTQRINRIKRKFEDFDYGSTLLAIFSIAVIIGMASGFISALKMPMYRFDTAFIRFGNFVIYTLVGGMMGFATIFLLLVLGACLVGIAQFISNLWG